MVRDMSRGAHTGLLVVHGIGAQDRGETLRKLARGLQTVDRDFALHDAGDGLTATLGGQPLRFYEVYWADIVKGDVTRGAFQIDELQSLSWFPWFNIRRGNYRRGRYSWITLAWWCVALPIANFFVLFAYYGAGLFAQIFSDSTTTRERRTDRRAALTTLDGLLDEYVGDVFTYVNSAAHAFYRDEGEPPVPPELEEAFARIVERFYEQLLKADADGCETIHIVSHSLGTVVMYHALSGFGFDPARADADRIRIAKNRISRVYTIGSPLEKIRFFWPRIAPVADRAVDVRFRWDNFVSFFDPVSGMLRSFDDFGGVANHRLLGGGFILGHVVYEHSPVFLESLVEGLCGRRIPFQRGLKARLWDDVVLLGETLLGPVALALVLAAGASLFLLAAMLLPFLGSLTVRWFLPPQTWAPVVDRVSMIFLALMVLAFLVAPMIRAAKVHSRYWSVNSSHGVSASATRAHCRD
jgi:hypothetical protein